MLNSGEVIIGVIVESSEPVKATNTDNGYIDYFYEIADLMCLNINTGELFPAGTLDIASLYRRDTIMYEQIKSKVSNYLLLRLSNDSQKVIGSCFLAKLRSVESYFLEKNESFPVFDKENRLVSLTGEDKVSICIAKYGYTTLCYKDYSLFRELSLDNEITKIHNSFIRIIEMQDTDYFEEVSNGVWVSREYCYVEGNVRELLVDDGIKCIAITSNTIETLVLSKTVDVIRAKYVDLRHLSTIYISKEASLSCICHVIALFNYATSLRFYSSELDDTELMTVVSDCMKDKNYEYMWEYCNREENQDEMAEILSNVEIIVY